MFSVSFIPAQKTRGGVSMLLSLLTRDVLQPRLVAKGSTLADCEVAFADAHAIARTMITPEAVKAAHGNLWKEAEGVPLVYLLGTWKGGRKPRGFTQHKWEAQVEPQG